MTCLVSLEIVQGRVNAIKAVTQRQFQWTWSQRLAAALHQVARVAQARGLSDEKRRAFVNQYTEGRQSGFLGEPGVNVLEVNLALDGLK